MRALSARYGWAAIIAFVFYHDFCCAEGELLSQGVDRGLEKHPILVTAAVGVTAAHLLNRLPNKLDPLWWVWKVTKGVN